MLEKFALPSLRDRHLSPRLVDRADPLPPRSDLRSSWWRHRFLASLGMLAGWGLLSGGLPTSAQAADRILVRFGPITQSVPIAELEQFAETGDTPPSLRLYAPLLTENVRLALSSHLHLDPNVGNKLVEDLLHSSAGERFLNTLQVVMPDTQASNLRIALTKTAKQPDGISLLGFLKTIPEEKVTIDAISVAALASQMNLPYWQSQTLNSTLEQELTVKAEPLQTNFDPAQIGPYWVWQETLTLRDYERDRTIPVDLYWSRRHDSGPLVVISHGFGADRRFLGYLASHLASYGLTVAAIEHPGSNVAWLTSAERTVSTSSRTESILPASEFIDRPKDVSFLLDRLQQLNRFSTTLRGEFNTDQVVVIGHSLGGYTALALAGAPLNLEHLRQFCSDPNPVMLSPADLLQCNAADLPDHPPSLKDDRVIRTIVLNPMIGRLLDETSLAQVTIPTLMLAGTNDTITPAVSQQFLPFTQLRSPEKYLLTAIGATHLSIGDPTNLNQALTQSFFVQERQDEATQSLRQLLQGVTLAFIEQSTPEADRYQPFLSSAYAQSFSTPNLQLRLNADLPPNFANWLTMAALPMEQLVSSAISQPRLDDRGICSTPLNCLLNSLPLAMFILPGSLPLVTVRWLKRRGRSHRDSL